MNFSTKIKNSTFLITGGAGFVGSNIVKYLFDNGAKYIRVLDNLSTGYIENLAEFLNDNRFEFVEGDIRNYDACIRALKNMDYVSHQAALGSVPRSIEDPLTTNAVNINGFLNVLTAARDSDVKRMVYAASSSTYGDSKDLPKIEGNEGKPLSPYAITKLVDELYAEIFSKVYGFNTVGLRYFNIFGPKQNATNPYAAVIAKVCAAFIRDKTFVVNGDGKTSRDFTYVDNAVEANMRAFFYDDLKKHEVFNIACGDQVSLLEMVGYLEEISGKKINVEFGPERKGDVRHSLASILKAQQMLNYNPQVSFREGLLKAYNYYLESII